MNNLDLDNLSPKNVDAHIGKHKLLQDSIRKEEIAQKKHQIQMIIRSWWFILVVVVLICIILGTSVYLYFFKGGIWITIFDKIFNWGVPSLVTYLLTQFYNNKNENPE